MQGAISVKSVCKEKSVLIPHIQTVMLESAAVLIHLICRFAHCMHVCVLTLFDVFDLWVNYWSSTTSDLGTG